MWLKCIFKDTYYVLKTINVIDILINLKSYFVFYFIFESEEIVTRKVLE